MAITDDSLWHTVYEQRWEDTKYPLPVIDLSQEFYKHTIRATVTCDKIPENWIRSGWLFHRLTPVVEPLFVANVIELPINVKQLIKLDQLTDKYYLSFKPMFRYIWINLKLEYYELD